MLITTRERAVILLYDLAVSLFSFWIARYFGHLPRWYWLVLSAVLWVGIGFVSGKLEFRSYKRVRYALLGIFTVGLLSGGILHILYTKFVPDYESDLSILLAAGFIILFEWALYCAFRSLIYRKIPFFYEEPSLETVSEVGINTTLSATPSLPAAQEHINELLQIIRESRSANQLLQTLQTRPLLPETARVESTHPESVLANKTRLPLLIIHLSPLNNVQHMNTLFAYTNYCLDIGGCIACRCTTSALRREKIMQATPLGINHLIVFLDYLWNRIIPKLSLTKALYYKITKGNNRALSRVEVLGKLYRAGFDVIHEEIAHGQFYVIACKIKAPIRGDKPNTGLLIRLRRVGKNGKIIGVYKFRTMFAYSEYLQPYIYKQEGLCKGGKIADDYRVNAIGKLLRRTWLDELPMLINWIKGDMKLVGIRPLSPHYFSLYCKELQELRTRTKPGLLPPFYADMPETLEEIQASEIRYLTAYLQHPLLTDWRYFWRIVGNIIFKGKRSR